MEGVQVGDIFVSSWGYDQTNIDFYQVISRAKKMVTVRRIMAERSCAGYQMASKVMPLKDKFLDSNHPYDQYYGKPFKRKLNTWGGVSKPGFKVDECSHAYKWDGLCRVETYTG